MRRPAGDRLSWENLRDQFGQEYNTSKDFKKEFRTALRQVMTVYPDAHIYEVAGGLTLYSSRPPLSRTTIAMPAVGFQPVDKPEDSESYPR